VPELAPLGPKERRRVHEICLRRHFLCTRPTPRGIAAFVAFLGCSITVGILGNALLARVGASDSLWNIAAMTIGPMLGWFLFTRIATPSLRPHYTEYLTRNAGPRTDPRFVSKEISIAPLGKFTCPKCSSSRVRDVGRMPGLMTVWFGCIAFILIVQIIRSSIPGASALVAISISLPVAAVTGVLLSRSIKRRYTAYECKDCRNRWSDSD